MSDVDSPFASNSTDDLIEYVDTELDLFDNLWYDFTSGAVVEVSLSDDQATFRFDPVPDIPSYEMSVEEATSSYFRSELSKVPPEAVNTPVSWRYQLERNIIYHTELQASESAGLSYTNTATKLVERDSLAAAEIEKPELVDVLTDLVALERDRELGFDSDELHTDPVNVLEDACEVLEALDTDPSTVITPRDQATLGIEAGGEQH